MSQTPQTLPDGFLNQLEAIVGTVGLITDPADMEPYLDEQRGLFRGETPCVVRPGNTEEVSRVLAACYAANVAIV
ncbi:MAG: hydroxyacid dehydrogenase, partial [Alphaproteobacteria bacterium]|nr:hydroxyacid dehydrogenase [Alphaproteobacteria bacterium]